MDIYEIKRRTAEKHPHFFSRQTLKFFGQTLKDFKVYKQKDGTYLIIAPSYWNGKLMGYTKRIFDPETNELKRVEEREVVK